MGVACYDSFQSFSLPIRPTKPIPKHMPDATSPQTSEPCSASTRGLPNLFRSTIAPSSASKTGKPAAFLHALLRPASRPRIIVTGKPGSFHLSLPSALSMPYR